MISELRVLGGDAVIAKDVDSKRQLTEPLKSFIYAPEPAGRRRGKRQSERGKTGVHHFKKNKKKNPTASKCSRLTSSPSPGTVATVSD